MSDMVRLKVIGPNGTESQLTVARLVEVDGVPFDYAKLQVNSLSGEDIAEAFNLLDGRILELERLFERVFALLLGVAPNPGETEDDDT